MIWILCASGCQSQEQGEITFYLVRHAEKEQGVKDNPPLNEDGLVRSRELASMLSEIRFDAIYATQFERTRATVQPVADMHDQAIYLYDHEEQEPFVDYLFENYSDANLLIAGHAYSIPKLANTILGEQEYEDFEAKEWDNLLVITAKRRGNAKCTVFKYGK